MNYNGDQYYEKITLIQQCMCKREKRRLELEKELFVYCRSDKRISQMKCSKLRNYLREISDREERAKMRNLDLLSEVEKIENGMKNYQPNPSRLLQLKVKVMDCQSFMDPVYKSAVANVMGQQTQAIPSNDHILPSSPKSSRYFPDHLQSGLLKDSSREDIVSKQPYFSDYISSSKDTTNGHKLSDKQERTTAELPTICALTISVQTVPSERNEHKPSPPVTLTAADDRPSPCSSGPMGDEKPIGEKAHTSQSPEMEKAERSFKNSIPGKNSESPLSSDEDFSVSKSSALSLSLTQSELDEDLLESEAADKQDLVGDNDSHCHYSPTEGVIMESLSQRGLFKLLDTIEGQFHAQQSRVYSDSSIDAQEHNRIICLCNSGEDLNGEDPKACGAVVLHELQRLSWSTEKGCLLPLDVVSAHRSWTNTHEISDCLLPDAAQLWDRWFKHALLLKERHVLTTEHLVQLFTPLLLERHATYGHQAKVLLRTLLSRSSEECPSEEDESDVSFFGPAPLPDSRVVRPLQKQRRPELQSSEEDSQDESPVESVLIRESKAYQLLKQSAMQKRIVSSKEEDDEDCDDLSGINEHEEDSGWAKRPLHQDPYPGTEGAISKAHSALQSKEFWGDSDDSYCEIEAALRPQPFDMNNVDTDDFYN
ncbi:centrosomal protein kizuna isoform X2 [Eucyclogobius newberryi]|uniref:centrosomal protein kizuna isoform X2 n=2 Tax=Eucyclogobius newberryi TaxID=166745 RepID=UPI003B59639D